MTKKKRFYETYASLILAVILLMSTAMALQAAYPGVGTPYGTVPVYPAHPAELLPVVGNIPEYGYYGGYWAMWDQIMPSLASIGISSATTGNYISMSDDWSYWDKIWDDPDWQYTTQNIRVGADPPEGWDLTAFEWWLMPTGQLWNDAVILTEAIPPNGYNVWPYINEKSDNLYWSYQAAEPAAARKSWIDAWQFELMRDPVMANVYFPYSYDIYSSYVNNWYGQCWFYDIDNLAINATKVNEVYDAGNMSLTNRDRLLGGVLNFGTTEDWWNYNPAFIATYTEEAIANLHSSCLYAMSLSEWPVQGQNADPTKFISKPDLATGPPVITNGGLTATISLRENVVWSDGVKFNATDVKFTYDLNLVSAAKAVALGDFAPIVDQVNIIDEFTIELILDRPYEDLECILSNSWGLSMLPEHSYRGIPVSALRGHITNWDEDTHKALPVLGAFKLEDSTTAYLKYVQNPLWYGNDLGYTLQDTINELWMIKIEDPAARFASMLTHEIDFGEYPTAPHATFESLEDNLDLTVFDGPGISSNGVWFNINNPYLSNRYFRLAISYAIPYGTITTVVLPSWGIEDFEPRGNLVNPLQYYNDTAGTSVRLWDDTLIPYEYNTTTANAYLDMWKNSRILHAPNAAVGPVGDADFSGLVELDDYLVWFENFGNTEEAHDFLPGNDEDADFDNDNTVDGDDFTLWASKFGVYYPDGSTTKTYPY